MIIHLERNRWFSMAAKLPVALKMGRGTAPNQAAGAEVHVGGASPVPVPNWFLRFKNSSSYKFQVWIPSSLYCTPLDVKACLGQFQTCCHLSWVFLGRIQHIGRDPATPIIVKASKLVWVNIGQFFLCRMELYQLQPTSTAGFSYWWFRSGMVIMMIIHDNP